MLLCLFIVAKQAFPMVSLHSAEPPNGLLKQTLFGGSSPNAEPRYKRPRGSFISWLGVSDLFQTFEELESVVDKEAEIANIRELLDESKLQ